MIRMKEKVAAATSAATLALAIIGVHVSTQVELAIVTQRIDNMINTNERTLEVLERLAVSVDKLSDSVARLDERTKTLERTQKREFTEKLEN